MRPVGGVYIDPSVTYRTLPCGCSYVMPENEHVIICQEHGRRPMKHTFALHRGGVEITHPTEEQYVLGELEYHVDGRPVSKEEYDRLLAEERLQPMRYPVAEKFKSLQGEGLFAGVPMAFIRFVGCSVSKKICHGCDTDYDRPLGWRGGGEFTAEELLQWAMPYEHICLTGGEPLDQDLEPLLDMAAATKPRPMMHIETSGTKPIVFSDSVYVCVSPKPGYLEDSVLAADEVKIIVPGLGNGDGWPQIEDALRWHKAGKMVFLQPRNGKFDVDRQNLLYVLDLLREYPEFRLSTQMHKILKVQ